MSANARGRFIPAFSIWAWLALTPFLVLVLGGLDTSRSAEEWGRGVVAAFLVNLIVGGVIVLFGVIERVLAKITWLRWTFVVVATLVLSAARPTAATAMQRAFGIDLIQNPFPMRVALNLVVFTAGIVLVYVVRDALARMLRARRRLLRVLAQLQADVAATEQKRDQVALDFQRDVSAPILDAIGSLLSRPMTNDELAEELRWVSKTIIRQASSRAQDVDLHQAIEELEPVSADTREVPVAAPTETTAESEARTPQFTAPALPRMRLSPGPAWVLALCSLVIFLPFELNVHNPGLAIAASLGGAAVAFAGSWLLRQTPLPANPIAAGAIIVVCSTVIGLAMCVAMAGELWHHPLFAYYVIYCTVGFVILSLGIAIATSALRTVAEHQHRIALALADAKQRALKAQQSLAAIAERTARLLHTGIQSDIIATSLQLKLGAADASAIASLLDRVESALEGPGDEPSSTETLREVLTTALDAWSQSLAIELDVEDAALEWLAQHPGAAEVAFEAFSEGLTNAVRHSMSETARVAMHRSADGVEVIVTNHGRLPARVTSGMGLHGLDLHARAVTLRQAGHDVELRVAI